MFGLARTGEKIRSGWARSWASEDLGAGQLLWGIGIEEPPGRGQAKRIGDLPGLDQKLDRKHGDSLLQTVRCGLERSKAPEATGGQFPFKSR